MSDLVIKVEVLAGTSISQAITELVHKAKQLNTNMAMNFNGIEIFVTPHSSIPKKVVEYEKAIKRLANSELKHQE